MPGEFIQNLHVTCYLTSLILSDAGIGDLNVNVVNDVTKQPVPVQLIDNEDNTYTVELTPDAPGTYTTNLTYGGLKVPFNKKTTISPSVDVSKVQIEGLEQSKWTFCHQREKFHNFRSA